MKLFISFIYTCISSSTSHTRSINSCIQSPILLRHATFSSFPLKSLTNGSTYSPIILTQSLMIIFFFSVLALRPVIGPLLRTQTSSPGSEVLHDMTLIVSVSLASKRTVRIFKEQGRIVGIQIAHNTAFTFPFLNKEVYKSLNFPFIFKLFFFSDCVFMLQCTKISVISFPSFFTLLHSINLIQYIE